MTDTRYIVVTHDPPTVRVVQATDAADAITQAAAKLALPRLRATVTFTVQDYPEAALPGEDVSPTGAAEAS